MTEEQLLKMLQDGLSISIDKDNFDELTIKIEYNGHEVCQGSTWI